MNEEMKTTEIGESPVPPAGGEAEVKRWEPENTIVGYNMRPTPDGSFVLHDYYLRDVTRLQTENAALQQRLNVADQRVDGLTTALETCGRWFAKHSPTAPLIGGFGEAEHPMITFIRGAQSVPAAKVDCGNCAFVDGVCSTGCETQRIRAAQQ